MLILSLLLLFFDVVSILITVMIIPFQNADDAVKVSFELPPTLRNEAQFIFNVMSLSMPQKMKGTVTYIIKVACPC